MGACAKEKLPTKIKINAPNKTLNRTALPLPEIILP
jgi:hypothetical protein